MNTNKTRTISAQISNEEYERYKKLAEAQGASFSTWLKQSLAMMYPPEMQETQLAAAAQAVQRTPSSNGDSVMGFEPVTVSDTEIDALETALAVSFSPTAPTAPVVGQTPMFERRDVPVIPLSEGHPCVHLDPRPPPNFTATDCQGMCMKQRGRPCHWAPHVARQCSLYRSKGMP